VSRKDRLANQIADKIVEQLAAPPEGGHTSGQAAPAVHQNCGGHLAYVYPDRAIEHPLVKCDRCGVTGYVEADE
jgi:hypothetical protein